MQVLNLGNNESLVTGIFRESSGEYLALTLTQSKSFKTFKGAEKWLAKRNYNPDGTRISNPDLKSF